MNVAEPRFKLPSCTYFTNTVIPAMYTRSRERTEKLLSSVQYCSITTDIWTAQYSTKSYISLTVHCISSAWKLHSYYTAYQLRNWHQTTQQVILLLQLKKCCVTET